MKSSKQLEIQMTGAQYKNERKKRGLTQSALAALVGVRQSTISDRESEKCEVTKEAEMAIKSLPQSATSSV